MAEPPKTFLAYRTSHGIFEFAKRVVNTSRKYIG
jgi:hypothetical protein